MDFASAVEHMAAGHIVRRPEWPAWRTLRVIRKTACLSYGAIAETLQAPDKTLHNMDPGHWGLKHHQPILGDMLAGDWILADSDAAPTAAYRTAAPESASETDDVPYRPGPPTVEQVRAHEKRGGRWQVMDPEGKRPGEAWLEMLCVNRDVIILRGLTCVAALHRMEWSARSSFRPCMPDCTPFPWTD
jgi:hypothetical protein